MKTNICKPQDATLKILPFGVRGVMTWSCRGFDLFVHLPYEQASEWYLEPRIVVDEQFEAPEVQY